MAYQTNSNILVAVHPETSINVQATATGATQMRLTDSPGLGLTRAPVTYNELRSDGLKTMPRLGYKTVSGSYNAEVAVGGWTDLAFQAILRTAAATATSFSFASVTTVAIATNYLSCAAGSSFVTAGVRVGDVFYLSGTTVSGDNSVNAQVVALTTQTITVPDGTFSTLVATATGTLTILKKYVTGATPVRQSFTVEQYDTDIDLTQLFTGCRLTGMQLSLKPGQPVTAQYTFLGVDATLFTTGTSPYFTSPTLTTTLGLIADDSYIRLNGAQIAILTGLELNFTIDAQGQPTIGSLTTVDIFDNALTVKGTATGLRSDFSNLTLYGNETEFELFTLLQEPGSGPPKNALGLFFPRVKLSNVTANAGGGTGAKIETLALDFAAKASTTGYNASIASISSSAA